MRTWHLVGVLVLTVIVLATPPGLRENAAIPVDAEARTPRTAPQPAGTPTLSVQPPTQTLRLGESFTATVTITGLDEPLSAFQFDLTYDPALVSPDGVSPGSFLASSGRDVLCPEPAYPVPGTLRVACTGTGPGRGPVGDGALATLTLTALDIGESTLMLSGPQLAGADIPPASISVSVQDAQVTVVPSPAVTLRDNSARDTAPGMTVTHGFTLTNHGDYTDTFTLSLTGHAWPTTLAPDTASPLAAGQSTAVTVQVQVPTGPADAFLDPDSFTLTAVSTWNPDVSASVQGTTYATVNPGVDLGENQSGVGEIETEIAYELTVTNTGDYTDTIALGIMAGAWESALSNPTTGPLAAGNTMPVTLTLYIPEVVSGTQETTVIIGASGLDPGVTDTVSLVTTAVTGPSSDHWIYLPIVLHADQGGDR